MKTVRLKMAGEDGAEVAKIEGTFSEGDLTLLRAYAAQMARVRSAGIIVRGMPFISNMEWKAGTMIKFTCPPFTDGELYELLHVLRPLVLESEAASFQKVTALLGRRFQDKAYAGHQKYIRRLFEDGELSMYMQFSVGNQKLLDQFLLHVWLNGTQYHTDKEKADAWADVEKAVTPENARAIIISQLHSRVKALFMLLSEVELILGGDAA